MNRKQWEEKYADEIFDDWCASNVESLTDFTNQAWEHYRASLEEQQITEWEDN